MNGKPSITNESVKNLTQLTHLDIRLNENINEEAISRLTNLTFLRCNSITKNEGIQNLTRLKTLYLGHSITDEAFFNLTNLTRLIVEERGITDQTLKRLTQLLRLQYYSNNHITHEGLSHLTNLRHLNFRFNSLIDQNRALSVLTNLTKLKLYNGYDRIEGNLILTDESLKLLTQLKSLRLAVSYNNNRITGQSISCLTNLKNLLCGPISISADCILALTNLRTLKCLY